MTIALLDPNIKLVDLRYKMAGWLSYKDTGEVSLASFTSQKSAAALYTEWCPSLKMASWPADFFHTGNWLKLLS